LPTNQLMVNQVTDWLTHRLDDTQTILADMYDGKFQVNNFSKFDF